MARIESKERRSMCMQLKQLQEGLKHTKEDSVFINAFPTKVLCHLSASRHRYQQYCNCSEYCSCSEYCRCSDYWSTEEAPRPEA